MEQNTWYVVLATPQEDNLCIGDKEMQETCKEHVCFASSKIFFDPTRTIKVKQLGRSLRPLECAALISVLETPKNEELMTRSQDDEFYVSFINTSSDTHYMLVTTCLIGQLDQGGHRHKLTDKKMSKERQELVKKVQSSLVCGTKNWKYVLKSTTGSLDFAFKASYKVYNLIKSSSSFSIRFYYSCLQCGYFFPTHVSWSRHKHDNDVPNILTCYWCQGKLNRCSKKMNGHMEKWHKNLSVCKNCAKTKGGKCVCGVFFQKIKDFYKKDTGMQENTDLALLKTLESCFCVEWAGICQDNVVAIQAKWELTEEEKSVIENLVGVTYGKKPKFLKLEKPNDEDDEEELMTEAQLEKALAFWPTFLEERRNLFFNFSQLFGVRLAFKSDTMCCVLTVRTKDYILSEEEEYPTMIKGLPVVFEEGVIEFVGNEEPLNPSPYAVQSIRKTPYIGCSMGSETQTATFGGVLSDGSNQNMGLCVGHLARDIQHGKTTMPAKCDLQTVFCEQNIQFNHVSNPEDQESIAWPKGMSYNVTVDAALFSDEKNSLNEKSARTYSYRNDINDEFFQASGTVDLSDIRPTDRFWFFGRSSGPTEVKVLCLPNDLGLYCEANFLKFTNQLRLQCTSKKSEIGNSGSIVWDRNVTTKKLKAVCIIVAARKNSPIYYATPIRAVLQWCWSKTKITSIGFLESNSDAEEAESSAKRKHVSE